MPPPARAPSIDLALEAAQTAIATCAANGYRVSVVVVDASGDVRLAIAGDGASSRTIGIATRKAFTATTLGRPTSEVSVAVRTDTALAARINADARMITWPGAQLLRATDGMVIGALAVSGAPGGALDDACTTAGIARVQSRLR
jgi:uncharacterized protein GlcG (DUF336 family)